MSFKPNRLEFFLLGASVILTILIIFEFMPDFGVKVSATESRDGTADTNWYTNNPTNSTYTISTAKELAGLAQLVNGGNNLSGKTVNLAADITLNDTANQLQMEW